VKELSLFLEVKLEGAALDFNVVLHGGTQ